MSTLDINGYNSTFRDFVKFAQDNINAGDEKAIADAHVNKTLDGRKMLAVTKSLTDKVHKWTRDNDEYIVNDRTRAIFKNAIIDMFGGEAKIPENVKKAMLLSDYDCGKPLTARRIMAVKAEVDKHSAVFNAKFAAVQADGGVYNKVNENGEREEGEAPVTKAQVDSLVKTVLNTARGDEFALDILANKKVMYGILVRGDSELRSPADAKKKADAVLANLAELRQAAQGKPEVLAAGKEFLKTLIGKSVPAGVITNIVRGVAAARIDAMKGLSASSSGLDIHKAVMQFMKLNVELMVSSGAEAALVGAEENLCARSLIADLLVAKCGVSNLRRMQAALGSENADKLKAIYFKASMGGYKMKDVSRGLASYAAHQGRRLDGMFAQFRMAVNLACGVPENEIDVVAAFYGPFDERAFGAGEICNDLKAEGRKDAEDVRKKFLAACVDGHSPGAEKLRGVYARKLGLEPFEPGSQLACDNQGVIGAMLNWNVCSECRKFATGREDKTAFFLGLKGGSEVTLPDGGKLSSDFRTARDQLAAFVTKGAAKTYAELDARGKNKVHVVMSLLSQNTAKAAFDGQATALDPKRSAPAFVTVSDQARDTRSFTLSYDVSGKIKISFTGKQFLDALVTEDGDGKSSTTMVGPGSTMEASLDVTISADELDRLAGLDFTTFDDAGAQQISSEKNVANKQERIRQSFLEPFRFAFGGVNCSTLLKATFN